MEPKNKYLLEELEIESNNILIYFADERADLKAYTIAIIITMLLLYLSMIPVFTVHGMHVDNNIRIMQLYTIHSPTGEHTSGW